MSDQHERGVVIVSGVPGAGKTSVAHLLAQRFVRAAHIEADALQNMIVAGGLWPGQEPIDEGYRQLSLRAKNSSLLADSFFAHGFTPIIDDIVIGTRIDEYLGYLTSSPVYLVLLQPSLEVLERRNELRDKGDAFHQAVALHEVADKAADVGLVIDNSEQDVEATVHEIEQRLWQEGCIRSTLADPDR
ncbi:MAG: AAA family ATPase [Pseudomonadales bacterium]